MQQDQKSQVVWHNATVTRIRREAPNGHRGVIVWFTGHSGAGKSTIAHTVEECASEVLVLLQRKKVLGEKARQGR